MNTTFFFTASTVAIAVAAPIALAQEALTIDSNGNVGIGIDTPQSSLHLSGAGENEPFELFVQDVSGEPDNRKLFTLENTGDPRFVFRDSSSGAETEFRLQGGDDKFSINHIGTGGADLKLERDGTFIVGPGGANNLVLAPNGNLTIAGTLSQTSDVNAKRNIQLVDGSEILAKVSELPISTWEYKSNDVGTTHLGPMAQDFHVVFGLGDDEEHLAPGDVAGVALAAIQAQQLEIERLRVSEAKARETLESLRQQLSALERTVVVLSNKLEPTVAHNFTSSSAVTDQSARID